MSKRKDGLYQSARRVNGKTIFGYSRVSQEDAKEELERKILAMGFTHLSAESTLHEIAMNVWHPRILNLSPHTIKRYESSYVMYIRPKLGARGIGTVKMQDVQRFVNELSRTQVSRSGKGKQSHPMEPASVRFIYSVLGQIFKVAELSDIIVKSPCNQLVTLPDQPYTEPTSYTVEEARELIDNAPERLKLPIYLALVLGLRLGEVCGLMWDDLDRLGQTIRVSRQIDGDGQITEPKTAKSRRTIPVPKSVIEFIDAHGDIDEPYMIGMTRRTLEREWPKYLSDGQTFHKLRAGNAGLITYLTGSIQTAADILGHTSTAMTEKHYRGRRNHAIADGIESLTNELTNSKGAL
jgi:integrase